MTSTWTLLRRSAMGTRTADGKDSVDRAWLELQFIIDILSITLLFYFDLYAASYASVGGIRIVSALTFRNLISSLTIHNIFNFKKNKTTRGEHREQRRRAESHGQGRSRDTPSDGRGLLQPLPSSHFQFNQNLDRSVGFFSCVIFAHRITSGWLFMSLVAFLLRIRPFFFFVVTIFLL